ncbi:hypothetical protein [Bacteroides heparinolyticus]|uniref:hypothetical protein n=1 Tax=Prevotella heparinolytica TaxID=28113 RepID=UPI00359F3F9D
MAELIKELIDKLDSEEITNLQCIKMHGQKVKDLYKEWCELEEREEDDEENAEQFLWEWRHGDEPDGGDWPDEVWDEVNKALKEADIPDDSNQSIEDRLPSVELVKKWKKDVGILNSLRTSENAVKITLWRYQNPLGAKKTCARELGITKNNVKKWWNVCAFIDGAIADGGHVHPIRLEHDVIKRTILQAVEKAEQNT